VQTIRGNAHNLSSHIVGLLQKKRNLNPFIKPGDTAVFVLIDGGNRLSSNKMYISNGPISFSIKKRKLPYIENVPIETLSLLKEGDVVLITPDGQLSIIYDSESRHNCIFTTNRCNLKCIMCPQSPSSEADPLIENQITAIRLMARHKPERIAITGGEPTLLGSGLLELIDACKKYVPKTALTILTNGKKFKKFSFVKKIAEIQHSDLQFAIPLYSDDYSTHDKIVGIAGSFFDTLKGLHNLALFGQRIEIRTVVLPQNASRLQNLAEFIYRNLTFVSHIAFMGIEVTGVARQNADVLWQDPASYAIDLEKAFRYLKRVDMAGSIYNFQLCIMPEELWPFCRKSISDWKNGYLEECSECSRKSDCGGFFTTSGEYKSQKIHAL
jgi:His-Xaa-Ser system radical SAM maturase HxsC